MRNSIHCWAFAVLATIIANGTQAQNLPQFELPTIIQPVSALVPRVVSIAAGDITGDGLPDVLSLTLREEGFPNSVEVPELRMYPAINGQDYGNPVVTPLPDNVSYFLVPSSPNQIFSSIVVADIDRDNDADVLLNPITGPVLVFLNSGGSLTAAPSLALSDVRKMLVLDVNLDGNPDIASLHNVPENQIGISLGDGSGSFASTTFLALPGIPQTLAVIDLDGANALDLVATTAEYGSSSTAMQSLTVFLHTGSGFTTGSTLSPAIQALSLHSGHFTSDFALDLVLIGTRGSCGFGSDCAHLLRNDGLGNFNPAPESDRIRLPRRLDEDSRSNNLAQHRSEIDLDNDGHHDLVFHSGLDEEISVLFGSSDGTFELQAWAAIRMDNDFRSFARQGVLTTDLNNDGALDLLVEARGPITLFNKGDRAFSAPHLFAFGNGNGFAMQAVDITGDGELDIVGCKARDVIVLPGQQGPDFGQHQTHPENSNGFSSCSDSTDVLVADFDQDGTTDVIQQGSIAVVRWGSGTTFLPSEQITGQDLADAGEFFRVSQSGDVNGDGFLDLVLYSIQDGTDVRLRVYLYQPTPGRTFTLGQTLTVGVDDFRQRRGLLLDDLNQDGHLDLATYSNQVFSDPDDETLLVYFGNGDGSFDNAVVSQPGLDAEVYALKSINIDGDSDLDMLALLDTKPTGATVSELVTFRNEGAGRFTVASRARAGRGNRFDLGDINGDGIADAVFSEAASQLGTVSYMLGIGDGIFQPAVRMFESDDLGSDVVLADINNDGNNDLLIRRSNSVQTHVIAVLNTLDLLFGNGFED